jgi:hypothetical protein
MSSPSAKPPPSLEDQIASLAAQMEKLVAAVTATQGNSAKITKMSDSLATLQGNQGQLTVTVNRLQFEQLGDISTQKGSPSAGTTVSAGTGDAVVHAARHGHKLFFPTFDGSKDPLPWLNRCDQFFRIHETPEAGKVFLATFYMSDDASQWCALLERNHGQSSWPDFIKLINQRFGPPLRSDPLGKLIQLRRETTVAEYQSKFLALLARCDDLVEKHQIHIFMAGLGKPLCTDVELKHPATLDDAMALARIYEQWLAMTGDSSVRTYTVRSSPYRPPSKPLLFTAPSATSGTSTTPLAPRFKRLTAVEMAAKHERGECFHYTEKYSHAHAEVCQPKGVFLLQMDDESPSFDADVEEDPRVSLHAITGLSSTETMQLEVRLNDHTISALVDSGSTHSFISVTAACRLHLDPVHKPGLHVGVANGDQVACTGICCAVHIFIDSEEFVIDLFVIPLEGYDMVLGV